MTSGAEDDMVFLVLTDPSDIAAEEEGEPEEILVLTSEIRSWDVFRILHSRVVRVHACRSDLVQGSSYFRSLLGGSFSESGFRHVPIRFNLIAAISVLQCLCGCPVDVEPENFLFLLEGALFFGVEILLSECKAWFQKVTSTRAAHSLQISVDAVIEIWNYSIEHGISFVSEMCTAYLAQNFVRVITCSSFVDLPYDLLCPCIEHPDLTVHSEKQFCEALLLWVTGNVNSSRWSFASEKDYVNIFKKVRVILLPLAYSAGKRSNYYFSSLANDSINAIFDIMGEIPARLSSTISYNNSNLKIRLTQYSEKIDLSGCVHLMVDLLYLTVLPSDMDSVSRRQMIQTLIEGSHQFGANYHISRSLSTTLTFTLVSEVDMSKCRNLQVGDLINFMCLTFPSLQILKLSYCSHFKIEDLFFLLQNCSSINDLDLTVDISPIIPTQVSVFSTSSEEYRALGVSSYTRLPHQSMMSNITRLTLEGRTDLDDMDLLNISAVCYSLYHLNLKGCATLTDVGISKLIHKCTNIRSIIVSYTSFGSKSILELCSDREFPNTLHELHHNSDYSYTMAFRLQQLHMDGCKGIEASHMKQLMRCLYMLESLSLRETPLLDDDLSIYRGSLLESLDISGTLVSHAALCHVLRENPGIRSLKVSGCKNLYDTGGIVFRFDGHASSEDRYSELNPKCSLEEVSFGWGFNSSSITKMKCLLEGVKAMTLGLGASLDLSLLPDICSLIESLILRFQVISDSELVGILKSSSHLKFLALCYCLGDLTSKSFQISMMNLKSLKLERVTPWMTNEDLAILTENFSNLTELSLSGCKLLNSDAQWIISSGWPGLTVIHLEDCGNITSSGVSCLFDCIAIEDLLLRHNGRGIGRNIISDAARKLPQLRKIALDTCDACEGGFDSPSYAEKCFLSTVKIARCKRQTCSFDLQNLGNFRPVHKDTIVQVWNSRALTTARVEERV